MDPALKSLLQNCLKYGLATRRSCNSALCDKQPCSVRVNDVVLPPILLVLLHVLCPQRRVLHDSDLAPRRLSLERITKQTTTTPYLELGKKAKLMFFPTGLRLTQGFGCLFSRLLGRFRSRFQSECRQHRSQVLKSFSPSGRPWRVNLSVGRKLCFVC